MGKHKVIRPNLYGTHPLPSTQMVETLPASSVAITTARRAVFLDRDGVINRPVVRDGMPFPPATAAEFELLDGVPEACRMLHNAGYLLIVATNQPDVGRGTTPLETVEAIHRHMLTLLPEIDRVEVCYHPGGQPPSPDRKPAPGMLLRAAAEMGIDLSASFMVGDRWRDVDCGHAAGCRTFFIDYGYTEALRCQPDFTVRSLLDAASYMVLPRFAVATDE
ncbi:MAG: D-glycero-alpha-D-manno-heptose-1,7-bisphosphate 7-phosphatase [Candidatus Methylacidiphilales bacterium]|nr:HAD family hydrolase [Candidatus Methylacidiphilales bacterium]